jgi:hypothetical protein
MLLNGAQKVSNITIFESTNIYHPITDNFITCSNYNAANSIVNAVSAGLLSTTSVQCSDHIWKIKYCGMGKLEICVDCVDSQMCAVDSATCSAYVNRSYYFSDCTLSCPRPTGGIMSAMVVQTQDRSPPPKVLFQSTSSTTDSISIFSRLSSSGLLYCNAYTLNVDVSKIAPNNVINANIFTTLTYDSQLKSYNGVIKMSTLEPSTEYAILCIAASSDGVTSSVNDMQANIIYASTTCCKALNIELISSQITINKLLLRAVVVRINSRPSADITVGFSAIYFSSESATGVQCYPLLEKSVAFASDTLVTSQSIVLWVVKSGTYLLNFTVSGVSSSAYS